MKSSNQREAQILQRQRLWRLRLPCHLCSLSKLILVPEYSHAFQQMVTARQTEVTLSPSSLSVLSPLRFLSLLYTEEMKQALHVRQSQMVPSGTARWLWYESRPQLGEPERFSARIPSAEHTACTPARSSASDLERGVCRLFQGGRTDGKELARRPRNANSLLKLLYEGLASMNRAKKGGDGGGKNRNIK